MVDEIYSNGIPAKDLIERMEQLTMNAKQEFIKAITQVLRLEANIYTMGAIEEIIDRLEVSDYTLFIAYFRERESNYESLLKVSRKGVNEFYELRTYPIVRAGVGEKAKIIFHFFIHIFIISLKIKKNLEKIMNAIFIIDKKEKYITRRF